MHVPVFAGLAVEWLSVKPDGIYVDCTVGAGGHAESIASLLTTGRLLGLDRDPEAVARVQRRLSRYPCASVMHANYSDLASVLNRVGVHHVDGVLIDAGISSDQLDDPQRGFSFQMDGPLDMRMDTTTGSTAAEWLNSITDDELAAALHKYGDVKPARRIASAIMRHRDSGTLNTTRGLAEAVHDALSFVAGTPEETRTVFQAIRIAVNNELQHLEAGLHQAIEALAAGGRIVAISFHSGEDRVVKHLFQQASRVRRELGPDGRVKAVHAPMIRLLTPKPLSPGAAELASNPRAHSAKLRAAEKLMGNERSAS